MPKLAYIEKKFHGETLRMIETAEAICREYAAQGYIITLRQLYYQFVARGYLPNRQTEYKRLGGIVNDARLAGLIDWSHMEDRTRNLRSLSHWAGPESILRIVADQYREDKWNDQEYRPEVWIEKDALAGVIEVVCNQLDVPFFSCRGYTSQSEMWSAGQRLRSYRRNGQTPVVLHLGDHDPSGIDMSRDITDRLELFTGRELRFERLALNMNQVQQYAPPPNPAKTTDSRYAAYIQLYGDESWELDALDPPVLAQLITDAIMAVRDEGLWAEAEEREAEKKEQLQSLSDRWGEVEAWLGS